MRDPWRNALQGQYKAILSPAGDCVSVNLARLRRDGAMRDVALLDDRRKRLDLWKRFRRSSSSGRRREHKERAITLLPTA